MIKYYFILFLISGIMFPQGLKVTDSEKILSASEGGYYYPQLSPDGTKLLVSTESYKGLWLIELSSGSILQLSDHQGAGYMPSFSNDGSKIFYRWDDFSKGRRFSSIIEKDLIAGTEKVLEADERDVTPPLTTVDGNVLYTKRGNLVAYSSLAGESQNPSQISFPFVKIEDCKIALYVVGEKKILTPLGEGNYIWPFISPDGRKLLFTLAGRGTFVADLEGRLLSELGKTNAPRWINDEWIVGMEDKDDGVRLTASDIIVSSIITGERINITKSDSVIELYPSSGGNKIAYNTIDGDVYLLTVEFEEHAEK